MNKFILAAATLMTSIALSAAAPKVMWLDTMHDFGAFNEELGLVQCTFMAINAGDEPLVVISAQANCGCTRPKYTTEAIDPGDTLTLAVAYDATGRPGRFDKKVYVNTNDGQRSTLRICGTVIGTSNSLQGRYPVEAGMARLNTTVMPFGEITRGHTAGNILRGYNNTSDTIHPQLNSVPSYINAIIEPAAVPPGEQFVISATAASARTPEWGWITDSLTFRADPRSKVTVPISTVLIVREDFSTLTPEQLARAPKAELSTHLIDLRRVSRNDKPSEHTFTITNNGEEPLMIRRVYTPDNAVSLRLSSDKVKSGQKATVTVRVDPSKIGENGLLNARLTVITNDPEHTQALVRVVGQP